MVLLFQRSVSYKQRRIILETFMKFTDDGEVERVQRKEKEWCPTL
jgi:hypothetical protein